MNNTDEQARHKFNLMLELRAATLEYQRTRTAEYEYSQKVEDAYKAFHEAPGHLGNL